MITLIELAIRGSSKTVVQMVSEEHTQEELELLVTRFLYYYIDAIGDEEFYGRLSECANVDWRKHRQVCHRAFWGNYKDSIASVQKDFPDFFEDWL